MPERFAYPLVTDLWMPMHLAPNLRSFTWTSTSFGIAGRLKPGAEIAQARAEVEAISSRLRAQHRELARDRRVVVLPLKEGTLAPDALSLMMALLGAAVVVLSWRAPMSRTCCWRDRGVDRGEIAVRLALGRHPMAGGPPGADRMRVDWGGRSLLGSYLSWFGFNAMSAASTCSRLVLRIGRARSTGSIRCRRRSLALRRRGVPVRKPRRRIGSRAAPVEGRHERHTEGRPSRRGDAVVAAVGGRADDRAENRRCRDCCSSRAACSREASLGSTGPVR
jgi:hypothetical protein